MDQRPRLHSQWDTHWVYDPGYITGILLILVVGTSFSECMCAGVR